MHQSIKAAIRDGAVSIFHWALLAAVVVLAHIGAQHQWPWVREQAGIDYDPVWTAIAIGLGATAAGVFNAVHTYIHRPHDPGVIAQGLMDADIECPGCFSQDMPLCQVICDDCQDAVERGEYLVGYSVAQTDEELSRSGQVAEIRQWGRDRDERGAAARAIAAQMMPRLNPPHPIRYFDPERG